MGKVYVIRKEESAGLSPNVAVGPGGPSFILGTSPENVDYGKYDEMGGRAGRYARRLGRLGRAGRIGAGFLGGLRNLYDATSSGQPGALTAAAGGGFSGYYGTQGLEQFAADAGARFGRYRDAPPKPDMNAPPGGSIAGVTHQARQDARNMMPSGGGIYSPSDFSSQPPGYQLPDYTKKEPTPASDTDMGRAFSEAAPPPSLAPPTTYQTQLPGADPKHPLVREQEKENEAGVSSATTDGY